MGRTILTAALLGPSGEIDMMAWAQPAFSWVNTKGVSALFSSMSLWTTRMSPPHLAEVVDMVREADLDRLEKRVLTNMMSLKEEMLTILTQNMMKTKITGDH